MLAIESLVVFRELGDLPVVTRVGSHVSSGEYDLDMRHAGHTAWSDRHVVRGSVERLILERTTPDKSHSRCPSRISMT